jgi:peptidoglycan hydrolase-like protein with peptidoglycan-binding domain
MDAEESVIEAHRQLQDSVLSWGNLLIATGGSLKPAKCFYHLISFVRKHDGSWQYANNETVEELALVIPQPNNTVTPISHLGVNEASKTLGSMTCPSGDPTAALQRVQEKAQGWIDEVITAGPPRRNIWFLVDHQFTPKVMFGCSTITADFRMLTLGLHRQYYQLLPLGGIRRSVKTEARYLGKWFSGSGCPHLGVECLVGQLEKLLTHYGCQTVVDGNVHR